MLLDLPLDVRNSMEEGSITVSAVEELLCIKDNNKQSELGKLIKDRHLTVKKTRHMLKGLDDEEFVSVEDKRSEESKKIQRSIDKSIVTLRLAMNGIATIIEDIEDNWVVYEILMQNRNLLHDQIDMMMKQRKKLIKHQ